METQDKISYGLTIKVGLPNYGSADCHISYSSSILEDETPETALTRVKAFVEANLETKRKELIAMAESDGEATVEAEEKPEKKKSKGLRGLARLKKNRAKAQEEDEAEAKSSESEAEEPAVEVESEEEEETPIETKKSSSVSDKIAALREKHGMTNSVGSGNSTASLKR